jgi:hypothetical protein
MREFVRRYIETSSPFLLLHGGPPPDESGGAASVAPSRHDNILYMK